MTMHAVRKAGTRGPLLRSAQGRKEGHGDEGFLDDQRLTALDALGRVGLGSPGALFDQGLQLLTQQLHVEQAAVLLQTEQGLERIWPAPAEGEPEADLSFTFAARALSHPNRPLVIRDAAQDPQWADHWQRLGVRSTLCVPLCGSGKVLGVLVVESAQARDWRRTEIAMVSIMAHLFSKTFEVEALRADLWRTREALELTSAVVADNALESPLTGLPNRHYLEIWTRSSLYLARRKGEPMAVATWTQPAEPGQKQTLKRIADALRGEDLLVDLGQDQLLLLLPGTDAAGAAVLLDRVRAVTGRRAMGATLWDPLLAPDCNHGSLDAALGRARSAQEESAGTPGARALVWNMLKPGGASAMGSSTGRSN